jgi:hypothetical protein
MQNQPFMLKKKDLHHETLIYINGFLDSISYINTFPNDGKTYKVAIIDKIDNEIQATLRDYFKVKNWIISTENIDNDWRNVLKKELRPYFEQIIEEVYKITNKGILYDENGRLRENAINLIDKVKQNSQFHIDHVLMDKFFDCMEKIILPNSELIRVCVNPYPENEIYEGYYGGGHYLGGPNDYYFDLETEILFISFGTYD